uniref:Uncharacterized protein n=1 Tax=Anguilla anguilla TaxID=7936 RepID=A0A0E9U7A1_ANGAN
MTRSSGGYKQNSEFWER